MTRRVVITGMGGVTAFGEDWPTISRRLREYENAVRTMTEWQAYDGLQTLLAAPIEDFTLPAHYTRKAGCRCSLPAPPSWRWSRRD